MDSVVKKFIAIFIIATTCNLFSMQIKEKIYLLDSYMTGNNINFISSKKHPSIEVITQQYVYSFPVSDFYSCIQDSYQNAADASNSFYFSKAMLNKPPTEFIKNLSSTNKLHLQLVRLHDFCLGNDLKYCQHPEPDSLINQRKQLLAGILREDFSFIESLYTTQKPYFATYENFNSFIIRHYYEKKYLLEGKSLSTSTVYIL
jgi:hypothetical protein